MDSFDLALSRLRFKFPYSKEYWLKHMLVENYHRHTVWSNVRQKDSATTLDSMMKACKENGSQCMFTGEHGWQGSFLLVWDMCNQKEDYRTKENNAKYPVGNMKYRYSTEAYWVKDRHEKDRMNCHIVLVARTKQGSRKINYILSEANETGFYGKPRLDIELIKTLTPEDVFVTSACIGGWKYEGAEEIWLDLARHFGDSFFFEVQYHNTESQKQLNDNICKLAKEHNIGLIAGYDTHALNDEELVERENFMKRNGIVYDGEEGWYLDFPTGKEAFRRFKEQSVMTDDQIYESLMNTCIFINECEEIEYDRSFKIPSLHKEKTHEDRVKVLSDMLEKRYQKEVFKSQEKYEGMKWELKEISDCNTEDYFITNEAIIRKGIKDYGGVLTTTSRGSAGSFISSKLLGFTTLDKYTSEVPMYAPRFLTSDRILKSHQLPDIDFNFSAQEPFVKATRDLIGEHGCYPLVAFGQLKEKAAWKMYADVKGVSPEIANGISKQIDKFNDALKYADDDDEKEYIRENIHKYISEEYIDIYEESIKYQGIIDGAKAHACGHLIFDGDIRYECGLIRCVSESTGNSVLCTVLDGSLLDSFGYVKNDYLIVSVVDLISKCWKSIGKEVPTVDELRSLVENDDKTWEIYEKGITMCVNQCEREKSREKLMRYKPKNPKEVTAFVAAIRPAFISLVNKFLDRVEHTTGEKKVDELLESSAHFMLYQESLMKIFSWLGVDMANTYDVIKSISKKKLKGKKLADFEDNLQKKWIENIGNDDNFKAVFQVVKDSAAYAFNSPHALSVAFDSIYIAYFKAHYPDRFYEVALNYYMAKKEKDKVNSILKEATSHFGFKLTKYEFGKNNSRFTVDKETMTISPDLSSIKGFGVRVMSDLMDMYNEGFDNIIQIYVGCKGRNINQTHIRKLIRIGYFHSMGTPSKLLKICDLIDAFYDKTNGRFKKQLSMDKYSQYGEENLLPYGELTSSGKTLKNIDMYSLFMNLVSQIDEVEYSISEKMANEHDVMGFVDTVDESFDPRVSFVQEIEVNQWKTPFFVLYQVATGKTVKIKVDKKYFEQSNPIGQYDMIIIGHVNYERPKKRKNKETGKWEQVGIETVLEHYNKIKI